MERPSGTYKLLGSRSIFDSRQGWYFQRLYRSPDNRYLLTDIEGDYPKTDMDLSKSRSAWINEKEAIDFLSQAENKAEKST